MRLPQNAFTFWMLHMPVELTQQHREQYLLPPDNEPLFLQQHAALTASMRHAAAKHVAVSPVCAFLKIGERIGPLWPQISLSKGAAQTRSARRHPLGEYCFIKLTKKPV